MGNGVGLRAGVLSIMMVAALVVPAAPAHAASPDVDLHAFAPKDGNSITVGRVAAKNPLDPPTWQLNAALNLLNNESSRIGLDKVVTSYPGSAVPSTTAFWSGGIDAGANGVLNTTDGIVSNRQFPFPLPTSVRFEIFFDNFDHPVAFQFPLSARNNDVANGSFYFPAKESDLGAGQYWNYGTRHAVDDGSGSPSGGSQRWGYDLGVVRWDGGSWTGLKSTAADPADPVNSDFLIWERPLYAMANGRITSCYRGDPDHPPAPFDEISYENLFGNGYVIDYGTDIVTMAHFKNGSMPLALCPADGLNEGLDIPITAGRKLGVIGNSGRSTAPHSHLHGTSETTSGVPMQFLNIRTVASDSSINSLGGTPTFNRHDGLVLHKHSLIRPNPCGFNPPAAGSSEVSYHGLREDCYQDVLNQATAQGYQPSFIDGYDVAGQAYLNVTFRRSTIGIPYASYVGLTSAQLDSVIIQKKTAGYRLQWVDSYRRGSLVRHAAIFHQRPGPLWSSFRYLTQANFDAKVNQLAGDGYIPVNISAVHAGGVLRYSGLFEKIAAPWTFFTIPASQFSAKVAAESAAGRKLTYVNGVSIGSTPYLTGVFVGGVGGTTTTEVGVTGAGHQTNFTNNLDAGRLTRSVTGYDSGSGSARFAAVWRSPVDTQITSGPSGTVSTTTSTFAFKSTEPFATRASCVHGPVGAVITFPVECTSPKSYAGLTARSYEFRVRSIDREGLTDPASATRIYTVAPRITNTAVPTISGRAVKGETLTASNGTWNFGGLAYTYDWFAGRTLLPTHTKTLDLTADHVGARISVRVTATRTGYTSGLASSAATAPVLDTFISDVPPRITGTPQVGNTLGVDEGTWTPTPASFTYQWYQNALPVRGATASTYELTRTSAGKSISVKVTARSTGFDPKAVTTAPAGPVGS